ncbi:MAG: 50S ribosomal protein L17 [Ignavibacteriae bacterium]|nr:50S ribosomal protein L17 [Ignavibacteriota bacterium]
MIHNRVGRKLKRTASHRKAMLCNMASSLFEHKKISTTEAKAKELRPFAEALITRAKHALEREQAGQLPTGQVIDIHNRREVYKSIRNKGVVQELFDTIAPAVATRPGGYTRIVKLGTRRGDAGRIAIIELVDFSAARDGVIRSRRKKAVSKVSAPKSVSAPQTKSAPVENVPAIITPMDTEPIVVPTVAPVVQELPLTHAEEAVAQVITPVETVSDIVAPEIAETIPSEDVPTAEATDESPEEPKAEA